MTIFAIISFIILLAADQATKYWAATNLATSAPVVVLNNILNLTLVRNTGAAFGILQGGRPIFLIITPIILIGIIVYYIKLPKEKIYAYVKISLLLILAGAVGNYIDRVRLQYVVDFLEFKFIEFPVFNLADIYVVLGTSLLAVLLIFFIKD